jgi:hypothetical protein
MQLEHDRSDYIVDPWRKAPTSNDARASFSGVEENALARASSLQEGLSRLFAFFAFHVERHARPDAHELRDPAPTRRRHKRRRKCGRAKRFDEQSGGRDWGRRHDAPLSKSRTVLDVRGNGSKPEGLGFVASSSPGAASDGGSWERICEPRHGSCSTTQG